MNINKKHIFPVIVICYIIVSLTYIGYDMWNNFKFQYSQQSFLQGQQAVIEQLVTQAQDPACLPFPVYAGDTEIQLVNTACLIAPEATDETKTTQ